MDSPHPTSDASLHDARVFEVAAEYLERLEDGDVPDRAALLARYPEIASRLAACLDALEAMRAADTPADRHSSHTLAPGTKVGRFRILRELGRGGMAVVYEAKEPDGGRVALKFLQSARLADPKGLRRFLREARATRRLAHPNVAGTLEVCEHNGRPFLVLALAAGSLQDLLSAGRLSWYQATRFIVGVCRGLLAAHQAGVIHRDIKPSNILLDTDETPRLADFGLALLRRDDSSSLTSTGDVVGSPHYMSPEQCRGLPADERSDIYSLGATYYALLVGQPPFTGDRMHVMYAHCHEVPPDLHTKVPDLPEAVSAVIRRAMAKAPGERHPSAAVLLADLESVLDRTAKPTRRRRHLLWIGLLLAVLAVLLCWGLWRSVTTQRPNKLEASTPPRLRLVRTFQAPAQVMAVAFAAPSESRIVAGTISGLAAWDVTDGTPVRFDVRGHLRSGPIVALAGNGQSRYLFAISPNFLLTLDTRRHPDRLLYDSDRPLFQALPRDRFPNARLTCLATDRAGDWVLWAATADEEQGKAFAQQMMTGKYLAPDAGLLRCRDPFRFAASSPTGSWATVSGTRTVRIWNPAGNEIATLITSQKQVGQVAFVGDRELLVSGPQEIERWDLRKQQCVATLSATQGEVGALATAADGRLLAWVDGGVVRITRVQSGVDHTAPIEQPVTSNLMFSADGNRLLVGAGPVVSLWDLSP